MKKRLLAMLLAAVFAVSLTACGSSGGSADTSGDAAETESAETAAEESADSGDKKVLRVAMECAYAPYNWTQPDDSNGAVPISDSSDYAYGYDVMMAQHIADELGYLRKVDTPAARSGHGVHYDEPLLRYVGCHLAQGHFSGAFSIVCIRKS